MTVWNSPGRPGALCQPDKSWRLNRGCNPSGRRKTLRNLTGPDSDARTIRPARATSSVVAAVVSFVPIPPTITLPLSILAVHAVQLPTLIGTVADDASAAASPATAGKGAAMRI